MQHEGFSGGGGAGDAVALFAQNLFERGANLGLVVDDQNVVHEGSPFSSVSVLPSKHGRAGWGRAP